MQLRDKVVSSSELTRRDGLFKVTGYDLGPFGGALSNPQFPLINHVILSY